MTAVRNPYWDVVAKNPGDDIRKRFRGAWEPDPYLPGPDGIGHSRSELVQRYSWAIPSPATLDWLVTYLDGRRVVEIGAGTGYWAWLLGQHGVDVAAYDADPPTASGNHWHCPKEGRDIVGPGVEWAPVRRGNHRHLYLPDNRDRVLFLSWPPYSEPMGRDVLAAYRGDTVIYVGEDRGGCTGDDDMFALFDSDWRVDADCLDFVYWSGLHDRMTAYRRARPLHPRLP